MYILDLTHGDGENESWYEADESKPVPMDTTDNQHDNGEHQMIIGPRCHVMRHHCLWGRGLTHHHYILDGTQDITGITLVLVLCDCLSKL